MIAKAGKPLVKVTSLGSPKRAKRLGFMTGEIDVPKDFDSMGADEIERFFGVGKKGNMVMMSTAKRLELKAAI